MIEVQHTESSTSGRDATFKLIDWFDARRVRSARILVVGAGAIGNEVLKNLAMLGVGNIFIFDRDTVEISNLSRSILFSSEDVDQPKAHVAARAVKRINPDVIARSKVGDVSWALGLGLVRRMDVVVAGLDNVDARFRLNDMCLRVGRPWIEAGISVLNGHVSVYRPDMGACYECYTSQELRGNAKSCVMIASRYERAGKVATTPTMASIVGGVQAQEALKLLHLKTWEGRTLSSRKFVFNGTGSAAMIVDLTRRADCDKHHSLKPKSLVEVPEFSVETTTVGELFDRAGELLGSEVSLRLNFLLATRVICNCPKGALLLRPLQQLYFEDLRCEKCNFQPVHVEAVSPTDRINRQLLESYPELRESRLADIGVPPLDIIRARGSRQRRMRKGKNGKPDLWVPVPNELNIELTGDLRPDFNFDEP